jgi:hypothetical protein
MRFSHEPLVSLDIHQQNLLGMPGSIDAADSRVKQDLKP